MTNDSDNQPGGVDWTPAREKLLLLTLAAIQFTTTLDFIIILPLGPQYMEVLHINPRQFGLIVAAYGIAAGISGLAAGFFLDWFDRKRALLFLYFGFALGTLFCALAPTYPLLVAARFFAGAFGGVVGAVILAIVGDVVPMERRGAAMGMVMSSFSVASIIGVPLGNFLAALYSWHVPFFAIAISSAIILIVAAVITPALRGHMKHATDEHPIARAWAVMVHPDHQKAYLFMAALTFAGFMIFLIMPTYMEFNVGFTQKQLSLIYLCGGLCTLVSMNWIGRWADRSGKLKVFTIMSLIAGIPILVVTNLPRVPVPAALCVTTALMICMSGRFVPAMAMATGAVASRDRGGFMSINSAVTQLSLGVASYVGGLIVGETSNHELTHFPVNGIISIICTYTCIYLARFLKAAPVEKDAVRAPVFVEPG